MSRPSTEQQIKSYLDYYTGDKSWGDHTWNLVEAGKHVRTDTPHGAYDIKLQDGKLQLTFTPVSGIAVRAGEVQTCPTKFTAINRAQEEADDHCRRTAAFLSGNPRLKPPKW
jgi:hypothetical protein